MTQPDNQVLSTEGSTEGSTETAVPADPAPARWHAAAAGMAARLRADGLLHDPLWYRAFCDVPRHLLLPDRPSGEGERRPDVAREDSHEPDEVGDELAFCYGVVVLEGRAGGRILGTGLAPEPGRLAWMLGLLGRRDRPMRILQVGIGHGYLTALLCAGIGDGHVVVVEPDPRLAASTGAALGRLGWSPTIVGPDQLGAPEQAGVFDGVLVVVGDVSRSPIPLWKHQGAPWTGYLAQHGRLVIAPLYFPDLGRGAYVVDRAPDGRIGRMRGAFEAHPLTERDRMALAYLRQNPTLTARLRATHVAGNGDRDGDRCLACHADHGTYACPPCDTRLLADTAHAAGPYLADPLCHPFTGDPAADPDPATDAAVVDYLSAYPKALTDVLAAHAADQADPGGHCPGCRAAGTEATAPCHRLALAQIAAARSARIRASQDSPLRLAQHRAAAPTRRSRRQTGRQAGTAVTDPGTEISEPLATGAIPPTRSAAPTTTSTTPTPGTSANPVPRPRKQGSRDRA